MLSLLVAAAGLVATALAAPAPAASHGLVKRSFKAHANGRTLLSPLEEVNRVYRKYGWEIIIINPSENTITTSTISAAPEPAATSSSISSIPSYPAASSAVPYSMPNSTSSAAAPTGTGRAGSEDGTVAANPEEDEISYTSPVTIGGNQKLNLNFDTGSADLWVYSQKMSKAEIGSRSAFDSSKSSTFQLLEDATWNITYGDGSSAGGIVGYDTVDIGGSTVQKQCVELATEVSQQFSKDENTDGLVGLAFSKLNNVQPQTQKTFFDNLIPELSEPVFTADLEEVGGKGTYEFGTIDHSKYNGEITYAPVDNSDGFWAIKVPAFEIDGKKQACSTCSPAIADTGTTLMMMDDDIVEAYFAQVPSAQYDSSSGLMVYDCSDELPPFSLEIGGKMFTIKGKDMLYVSQGSQCAAGLAPGPSGMNMQILGDVFLKQFFAVFDGGNLRFGVAYKDGEGASQ